MKANQKFVRADDAVSPVIGVILMVAITVVLAAVVFVLVSNLSEQDDQAPNMAFSKNDNAKEITVVKAPAGDAAVAWSAVTVAGCTGYSEPAGNVTAGNVVTCAAADSVRISHDATGTLLYQTTFS